jgi:hypothetical protein
MKQDYKKQVIFLPLICILLIIANCIFNNIILSMISSIILLSCSVVYIKIYSDDKIKGNTIPNERLIVISTIGLILSLGWLILNIFMFIIFQFVS